MDNHFEKINKQLKEDADRIFSKQSYSDSDVAAAYSYIKPIVINILKEKDSNTNKDFESFFKQYQTEILSIIKACLESLK